MAVARKLVAYLLAVDTLVQNRFLHSEIGRVPSYN
jgi:hypothetical protein